MTLRKCAIRRNSWKPRSSGYRSLSKISSRRCSVGEATMRLVSITTLATLLAAPSLAQPSRDLVYSLQRVLKNGCGERRIVRDGQLGPQTMDAYRRCRERFEFPAAGTLDIEAFLEGMRLRKLSLVLLHQFGRFQGRLSNTLQPRDASEPGRALKRTRASPAGQPGDGRNRGALPALLNFAACGDTGARCARAWPRL